MKQLTAEEWSRFTVHKEASLDVLTTELEYYAHGNVMGIILLDNTDRDYSFVVLGHNDADGEWQAVDLGVSIPTIDAARKRLERALLAQCN